MWWVLTSQHRLPGFTTLAVLATTNVQDHLFMAWQYFPPTRVDIWRTIRGQRIHCGYQWRWDNPFISEQLQPGDTINHSFSLLNLTPGSTIWWYLYAPGGPYDREIQGPLNSVTLLPLPIAPTTTPAPITWNILGRVLRCGNHYTFWAYGSWYAFLPTATSLTMWILVAGTFHRLDQTNEPTPTAGTIRDADARLGTLHFYIHIAYYDHSPGPDHHLVHYVTFDVTHHTWGTPEIAHAEPYHIQFPYHVSLALDIHDRPHVVFPAIHYGYCQLKYRNKIAATWSALELAVWSPRRIISSPSAWIDPTRNAFHVCAVTNLYLHWYNTRPCGGPMADSMQSLLQAANLPFHCLTASLKIPHIAQISRTLTVNHWEGRPPSTHQDDLAPAQSFHANMITSPLTDDNIAILFRDDDNHLAYLHRPPDAPWDPPIQLDPIVPSVLTTHYAHPNVISCLWQEGGAQSTTFHAIPALW